MLLLNRIIPVLFLGENGLVITRKFDKPKYVGDPINTLRIFNEKEVDEIVIFDIYASVSNKPPNLPQLKELVSECFMPLCYGGGITTIEEIKTIFRIGVEKISLNASILKDTKLITEASSLFGSQSIVVTIDVKKSIWGKYSVFECRGRDNIKCDPIKFAQNAELAGAGEIILHFIDGDGCSCGFDLEFISKVSSAVNIPVVVCGGARNLMDCKSVFDAGAAAVGAGKMFVFVGKHDAVLVNYPTQLELKNFFKKTN